MRRFPVTCLFCFAWVAGMGCVVPAVVGVEDCPRPALAPIRELTVLETEAVAFNVGTTGSDAGQMFYSAAALPDGAYFDSSTGAFAWNAPVAGDYTITFSATNACGVIASELVRITVPRR